jgi:hypothetical protein
VVQRAVIFIPPEISLDSPYAKQRINYALDRGYQLAAVVRDWSDVDESLARNTAQTVIVASSVYCRESVTQRIAPHGPAADRPPARSTANYRGDRYTQQTPAERFLEATAERWTNEFADWLLPKHPGE